MKNQAALGDKVGVHRNAVSKWENDEALPEGQVMVALPGVLDIDGHWLLTGDGDMKRSDPSLAVVKLEVIGMVRDGEVDPHAVKRLSAFLQAQREGDVREIEAALRELGLLQGSTSGSLP
jgi:transcriptional regulator with XRE-family HTH domain